MKKFMAALLAFAAVILFAGCGGKTVDTDSTVQSESIADAQTNSGGQASKVISAYYLGIGLDKESRWKMTEEELRDKFLCCGERYYTKNSVQALFDSLSPGMRIPSVFDMNETLIDIQ